MPSRYRRRSARRLEADGTSLGAALSNRSAYCSARKRSCSAGRSNGRTDCRCRAFGRFALTETAPHFLDPAHGAWRRVRQCCEQVAGSGPGTARCRQIVVGKLRGGQRRVDGRLEAVRFGVHPIRHRRTLPGITERGRRITCVERQPRDVRQRDHDHRMLVAEHLATHGQRFVMHRQCLRDVAVLLV